jgi:hypothetical protein
LRAASRSSAGVIWSESATRGGVGWTAVARFYASGATRFHDGDRRARGRGHSLTIDHGWREVADTVLRFVQRFV